MAFSINGGERSCHDIQLMNDTIPELTDELTLVLASSNSAIEPTEAKIQIADDDGVQIINLKHESQFFF